MKTNQWLLAILAAIVTSLLTGCFPAAIDSSGKFAYVVDNNYELVVYQIDATTGVPTVLNKYPAGSAQQPYASGALSNQTVAVDPAGRFLYVELSFSNGNQSILAYSIDQTSHGLTLLGQPFTWTGTQPNVSGMTVDALGRYVFVSDGNSNGGVYSLAINPNTGALTQVGSEFSTAGSAVAAIKSAVDPTGRFLFVLNSGNNVATMAINNDGSLTLVGNPLAVQGASALGGVAVDRTGSFLALTDSGVDPGAIYTVTVNRQTGALTQLSSITASHKPNQPAFDPTNQFLYVFSSTGNTITALKFAPATGGLTVGTDFGNVGGTVEMLTNSVLQ